jgi:hypothetical protein
MTLARTHSLVAVHAAERGRRHATNAFVVAVALALAPLPLVVSTSAALVVSAVFAVGALATLGWLAPAHGTERLAVLTAIADGVDDASVPAVAGARTRLIAPGPRAQLAEGLRAHANAGRRGGLPPGSRRVVQPRTAADVANELEELAGMVTTLVVAEPSPRVRGLAACELLLVDGVSSPLFATDGSVVRQELARIADLLGKPADA